MTTFFILVIIASCLFVFVVKSHQHTQKQFGVIQTPPVNPTNTQFAPAYLNPVSNHEASLNHFIYHGQSVPDLNQYIYTYLKSNGTALTQTIFPKPATKTLKVAQWQKQIRALDVAMLMNDPRYDDNHPMRQNPTMFEAVFQQYLKAYVQSFSNYQQYQVEIAIQKSQQRNLDLGVYDYLATLTFRALHTQEVPA